MILVDMSQISLASMMMHLNMNKTTKPDEAMVRHMILNSLRMYRMRFKEEYGELILCFDSFLGLRLLPLRLLTLILSRQAPWENINIPPQRMQKSE